MSKVSNKVCIQISKELMHVGEMASGVQLTVPVYQKSQGAST